MKKRQLLFMTGCFITAATGTWAQSDSLSKAPTDTVKIEDLSLEDLMQVPIVSASREKEDAFDAPVTSYVVTRQEIEKAGSTSIPEALRLCPAVFVTEVSNGTYSVDIRGLNNAPAFDYAITNKSLLVMIDNRPVFNQLQGGTFWANLPVDINDVERVEVVAGPSAALYGPNAATGVINIITKRLEKKGLYAYTNSQYDVATNSVMANASVGYKVNEKFSAIVSGNYNKRQRFVNDYYSSSSNTFVSYENILNPPLGQTFTRENLYPNPSEAIEKKTGNIFLTYKANSRLKFELDGGIEATNPLSMIAIGVGPALGYFNGSSAYTRAKGEFYGFTLQASNIEGRQSFLGGVKPYQYDYRTTDLYLDYTYKYKNLFSVRPAISYQNAYINDLPYKDVTIADGIFNGNAGMYNYASSIKLEATPFKWIRAVAAVRGDVFRYPADKTYMSYEFVINIKPNENHNIRLVASRAYQGSFIFPTCVNFPNSPLTQFVGNKNLNPAKVDLLEAGYRLKISKNLNVDLSLFHQEGSGYYQILATDYTLIGTNVGYNLTPSNLDLKTIQNGATISFNSVFWNNKIQFKPYVTIQNTQWENYSPYQNSPNPFLPPAFDQLNSSTMANIKSNATPSVFGGFFLNITPVSKWNINISGYMFDKYSLYGLKEQPKAFPTAANPVPTFTNFVPSAASEISGKVMINAKVSYQVIKYLKVFVNARNLTNNRSREFYGSDQIGGMYLVGVNFEY